MRVLLIHPGYLGDTVFLGPAVRALKARWPDGHVSLCVSPRGDAVARRLPGADEVVVFDKRGGDAGLRGLWRVGARLRALRPDLALVSHYSPRSGALGLLSRAPRRVGYAPFCDERVRLDRTRPFVDRALALAEAAGAVALGRQLAISPSGEGAEQAERALAGAARPVVGVVPGAEWATKRWGAERYGELARALAADGATIVLLGGPSERQLAAEVGRRAGVPVRDTVGNSVSEALAVLARCDLVVGGDTGLVHCARALGRPSLVIFGPTSPERHVLAPRELAVTTRLECQPCHDHGPPACPLGHHRCVVELTPAAVLASARALLAVAEASPRLGPR